MYGTIEPIEKHSHSINSYDRLRKINAIRLTQHILFQYKTTATTINILGHRVPYGMYEMHMKC